MVVELHTPHQALDIPDSKLYFGELMISFMPRICYYDYICSFSDSDYLLVQIVLKKSLKYKSEVFLGLFADARIGILGIITG